MFAVNTAKINSPKLFAGRDISRVIFFGPPLNSKVFASCAQRYNSFDKRWWRKWLKERKL